MEYKRLTMEKEYGCCLCHDRKCKKPNLYCKDRLECEIYNRLAEIEDKIKQGTLKEIPENAVVVPDMAGKDFYTVEKSEWDKMVKGARDIIHEREEKVRKETAEKFAERLKSRYMPPLNEWDEIRIDSLFYEIDEICKEITEGKNG